MDVLHPRSARRRRAAAWALRRILLPMRWFAVGWAPLPGCDGSEWAGPSARPGSPSPPSPVGPPAGHPERLLVGVPPTPVERELWAGLTRPS
ncbi:DUF6059 family protein [Kitasatospora sp. NPDC001309]|uniref:DUF6059 family protein n=1 Tax=Kitasatospora sp. NPDC001309 TaxID=3364013 RepID=UPI00368A24AE